MAANSIDKETTPRVRESSPPDELKGICSTCNNAAACVYVARNPQKVVWECEQFESFETPAFEEIVEKHVGQQGAIMSMLEEVQGRYGYIPPESVKVVAEKTGRPLVDIYGVATFYKSFSLKPRGKHLISVCVGTACHVRGGAAIAAEFERKLGCKSGETTADREFTLETVNCLGACAIGPIAVVDGVYFSRVNKNRVASILDEVRKGLEASGGDGAAAFPVQVSCPRCNHNLMDAETCIDGHPSVKVTASFGGEHGAVRLSSLYGSYNTLSSFDIPDDAVANIFCPHCHGELRGAVECPVCGAPMVPFIVKDGGVVQICTRRGCKGHMLDLSGINL